MTERQELKFNRICYKLKIYDPEFEYDSQCGGYKKLKELIESGVPAATRDEYLRWKNNPTQEELDSSPGLNYLLFLHPHIAEILRYQWDSFINLINS
jgi:hypothetical protein